MHKYSLGFATIDSQLTMLGPPATKLFPPQLALRVLEIYAMLILCYTCDVEKFAQEVAKIATLKGY